MKKGMILTILLFFTFSGVMAKGVILIIRREGKYYEEAYRGFASELKNECECVLKEHVVTKKCRPEETTKLMNTIQPKLVILMDNVAIVLYRNYQKSLKDDAPIIPSITLMGVMIKDAIHGLKKASGISYEIPIVTSLVSLRSVLAFDMNMVGVVHREYLNDFIKENRKFCNNEGIEIVSIALPNKSKNVPSLLKKALKELAKNKVKALWIPNDIALLSPELIMNVWIPVARKLKIPIVVGVEVLIEPKLNFGTFAVVPDHMALGSQAAEMAFEIIDNNWEMKKPRVERPLSVYKIINLRQAKKYFKIKEEQLKNIDRKLQ